MTDCSGNAGVNVKRLRVKDICVFLIHRKSIKKLDLKNLKSNQYSSPANKDRDDLASPAAYPQNGHRYYVTFHYIYDVISKLYY